MMSSFDAVLAQYEKNKNAAGGNANKVSQEDRMKKYFTTVLPKGVKTAEKRIRILPTKDGSSPFVEIKFHEIQVDGNWMKLYDPAQEGKRSPLNEVCEGLMMTGVEADKELARTYRSRKFYIVKVIDRDNEQDGPKFWRFKHNAKGDGILDKIVPIWRNKGDVTDPQKGRDLIITLSLTKSGNGKEYTAVNSVIPEDMGPLHTDEGQSNSWIMDELTWSDVYSKKPEEYLEMVARGESPRWDVAAGKYVSNSTADETISAPKTVTPVVDPQDDAEVDEDLPF
jgi:gp32 DNA binding protein like